MKITRKVLLGTAICIQIVGAPSVEVGVTSNHMEWHSQCLCACGELFRVLPDKVFFPNSTEYALQDANYWSLNQASVHSVCRVAPSSSADVSVALTVLKDECCPFAVKSGGHAAFRNASNIDGGVTIDFKNMAKVSISSDQKQVSVEPGLRWAQVYEKLDKVGLGVVGGRVADIGVGGLTLGGGISFFSGRYGWACDNFNNYEVVFADGTIHDVNYTSFPDLYFALRGGGNNFGIVTRFDLAAFPQGQMWGGQTVYSEDKLPTLFKAFVQFNINHPNDSYAAYILSTAYVQSLDTYYISGSVEYGIPQANPPIFHEITVVPRISDTLRITDLTNLTIELNASNPGGFRETYWTFMTRNDAKLMAGIQSIFESEVQNIKNVTGILPAVTFQPISTAMTSKFAKNGGNALGISEADGPLILLNTAIMWSYATDDDLIFSAARNWVRRSTALAKERGLDFKFIYQNYASAEQDVFPGYGELNKKKLQDIHAKYDPEGVFTRLQPGYFKI